jgi:hypothetical protein
MIGVRAARGRRASLPSDRRCRVAAPAVPWAAAADAGFPHGKLLEDHYRSALLLILRNEAD